MASADAGRIKPEQGLLVIGKQQVGAGYQSLGELESS